MAFSLMTWNVQRLTENSRTYKWDIVKQWLNRVQPDVLGLIEIGPDVDVPGYSIINYVNTLTWDYSRKTQLCIAAYLKNGTHVTSTGARTLRVHDSQSQKRAQLKANIRDGPNTFSIYIMHATASRSGGIDATTAATSGVRINKRSIYAGDFNYDLRLDAAMLNISNTADVSLTRSQTIAGAVTKTHKSGSHLDFALSGSQTTVQPVQMRAYGNWRTIDHAPVAFRVS